MIGKLNYLWFMINAIDDPLLIVIGYLSVLMLPRTHCQEFFVTGTAQECP